MQSVESPDIGKTPARGILLYLLYRFDFGDIVWPRGVRSLRIEAMQIMGLGEQKTIASNIGSEDQKQSYGYMIFWPREYAPAWSAVCRSS